MKQVHIHALLIGVIVAILVTAVVGPITAVPAAHGIRVLPRADDGSGVSLRRRPKAHELTNAYTFEHYKADFDKEYTSVAEHDMRRDLFQQRLQIVLAHNRDTTQLWKRGINHMTDFTAEERDRMVNGGIHHSEVDRSKLKHSPAEFYALEEQDEQQMQPNQLPSLQRDVKDVVTASNITGSTGNDKTPLPRTKDWRKAVPPVLTAPKTQGQCNSCWAHVAAQSIESAYAIATNGEQLNVLSQQEFVSCTPDPNDCGGPAGCLGSIIELALDYAIDNGTGVTQEWEYPYTSYYGDAGTCKFNASAKADLRLRPTNYSVTMPRNNPEAVQRTLLQSPVGAKVDVHFDWLDYESGIFTGCTYANNISIKHSVQIVGWGSTNSGSDSEENHVSTIASNTTGGNSTAGAGQDYWIVRNSWGAYWGIGGYIYLPKEPTGQQPECGWDVNWQEGYGCNGGPSQQWVCGPCGLLYDSVFVSEFA